MLQALNKIIKIKSLFPFKIADIGKKIVPFPINEYKMDWTAMNTFSKQKNVYGKLRHLDIFLAFNYYTKIILIMLFIELYFFNLLFNVSLNWQSAVSLEKHWIQVHL